MRRLLAVVFAISLSSLAHAGGGGLARKADGKMIRLFHPTPSKKGTILMFHGYSDGPKQWAEEAAYRHAQGYDVIVAALPGHGFVDTAGNEDLSRLPGAHEAQRYTKFSQAMFELAKARSEKVHVVGFSIGGAHALEVALTEDRSLGHDGRPVLRSAVAINPYLGPTPEKLGPLSIDKDRLAAIGDRLSFGLVGKLLAKKPFVFTRALAKANAGETDYGFTKATYGNVFAIGRFGDEVRARAQEMVARGGSTLPTYVVVSEKDPTANPKKGLALAKQIGAKAVVLPLAIHNPFSPDTNPDAMTRWQVRNTISKALREGSDLW